MLVKNTKKETPLWRNRTFIGLSAPRERDSAIPADESRDVRKKKGRRAGSTVPAQRRSPLLAAGMQRSGLRTRYAIPAREIAVTKTRGKTFRGTKVLVFLLFPVGLFR